MMTLAQIDAELAALHAARLRALNNKEVSLTVNGRQLTFTGPAALAQFDRHQAWLENMRNRLVNGGVRIRAGVPRG